MVGRSLALAMLVAVLAGCGADSGSTRLVWAKPIGEVDLPNECGLGMAGGNLYVTNKALYAFDVGSGEPRGRLDVDAVGPVVELDGRIYFAANDDDGMTRIHSHGLKLDEPDFLGAGFQEHLIGASPQLVYLSKLRGGLLVENFHGNGVSQFMRPFGNSLEVVWGVAGAGGVEAADYYVTSDVNGLQAIHIETGQRLPPLKFGQYTDPGLLASAGSAVFFSLNAYGDKQSLDELYRVDVAEGQMSATWHFTVSNLSVNAPMVAGGILYHQADGLMAHDLETGRPLWSSRAEVDDGFLLEWNDALVTIEIGGDLILGTPGALNGQLTEIHLEGHSPGTRSFPIVGSGHAFICGSDGWVAAVRIS